MINTNESKQVGVLYHVCNADSMLYNLKHNSITPGDSSNMRKVSGRRDGHKVEYAVSFTRNKEYFVDTVESPVFFQIVLDGDTLSDSYKISPYAAYDYRDPGYFESEEVIYFGPNEGVTNLTDYVIKVNVIVESVSRLANLNSSELSSLLDTLYECVKRIPKVELVVKDRFDTLPVKKINSFINLVLILFNYSATIDTADLRSFLSTCGKLSGGALREFKITVNMETDYNYQTYFDFFSKAINTVDEVYRNNAKYYLNHLESNSRVVSSDTDVIVRKIMKYVDDDEYYLMYILVSLGKDISQWSKPSLELVFEHNDKMESIILNARPIL